LIECFVIPRVIFTRGQYSAWRN